MDNLFENIYKVIGIVVAIYFFIFHKEMRKSLLLMILATISFYLSAYVFYFVSSPFNIIGTIMILIIWGIVLQLFKNKLSVKERNFWLCCILYVAIYHVLHYVFDPIASKNIYYAVIFVIYTYAGLISFFVYYFKNIIKY